MNHFLTQLTLDQKEYLNLIDIAIKGKKDLSIYKSPLRNKYIGMLFEKPSTRTRISFEVGIHQLGGTPIILSSKEIQLSRGESIEDSAKVFSGYLDGLMIRTFAHENVEILASEGSIPIINGLTDLYHPCQGITDYMTMVEMGKNLNDTTVCYVGDADNNVCHSLILGAAITGATIHVASPKEYRPNDAVIKQAEELNVKLEIFDDAKEASKNVDVLYTDVWISMGQENADEKKAILRPYQLNASLLEQAKSDAIVMHCLPAHKEEEITEEVFSSKNSVVFTQAENRLHAQKAMMNLIFS